MAAHGRFIPSDPALARCALRACGVHGRGRAEYSRPQGQTSKSTPRATRGGSAKRWP
jgi:hypothetical protein